MKGFIPAIVLILFLSTNISSQTRNTADEGRFFRIQVIPGEITKNINVWGQVSLPGRYEIPVATNLIQLLTYAGGPNTYSLFDEIKIYRLEDNGRRRVIVVDLEDPERTPESKLVLYDEDIVFIDYSAVVSWREIFSLITGPLAIISTILVFYDRISRN